MSGDPLTMSLVIATKGRPGPLGATLASLRGCRPLPSELIVVDGDPGGSAGPVVAEHQQHGDQPPARLVASAAGLPLQRNRGLAAARGAVVVFADDDVDFDPAVFAELAAPFADLAVVGATGRVHERNERRVRALPWIRRLLGARREGSMTSFGFPRRITTPDVPRDVEFVHGCLMAARTDVGAAIGFDEALPGYALAEDEDFGYRLSRAGRVRYVPSASVVHLEAGRLSIDHRSFNRTLVVHRAYLLAKNLDPGPMAWAKFAAVLVALGVHRALNREWSGVAGLLEGARLAWGGRRDLTPLPARLAQAERR